MTKKIAGQEVTSYVYNTENRLTEVWDGEPETGTLIAEYYYDPFGRRLWKEVDGTRTYYHYADEGLVAEMDAAGNVTKSYGWKLGGTWGTDPLFMKTSEEYYFYHNDHLGTPQKMTDPSGAVVWNAAYTSFGKAHVDSSSTVTNNLRFAGQYKDQETGQHYNRWRYYDTETGRYLRADPLSLPRFIIMTHLSLDNFQRSYPTEFYDKFVKFLIINSFYREEILLPQNQNFYLYGLNNPINLVDPWGLWGVNIGGSLIGADFSTTIYDTDRGWFPSTDTDIGVSTTAFGGGISITSDDFVAPRLVMIVT